jgi:hypothetical protein
VSFFEFYHRQIVYAGILLFLVAFWTLFAVCATAVFA